MMSETEKPVSRAKAASISTSLASAVTLMTNSGSGPGLAGIESKVKYNADERKAPEGRRALAGGVDEPMEDAPAPRAL